jgi:hypothetical protein
MTNGIELDTLGALLVCTPVLAGIAALFIGAWLHDRADERRRRAAR